MGQSWEFISGGWYSPLNNQWNNGIVEEWNIGYEKRMMS